MVKKNKQEEQTSPIVTTLLIILLFVCAIIIVWQVVKNTIPNEDNVELIINYSEISDDYDLENITYLVVDWEGNEIFGENYYSSGYEFTKETPIIQGENYYVFWVDNDEYYINPGEFELDTEHRNQSIVAKAYKKENLSEHNVGVYDVENYSPYETKFKKYDDFTDIAEFEIIYRGDKRTKFPFGALIIFEYDKNIADVICTNSMKMYIPDYYAMSSVDNDLDAFEIDEDKGEWERKEFRCLIEKYNHKNITNNKIKFTIIPNDFYMEKYDFDEEWDLMMGFEDKYANLINKPIFEGEITIYS